MSNSNLWPSALSTGLLVQMCHGDAPAAVEQFVTAWRQDSPQLLAVAVHTADLTTVQATLPAEADGLPLVVMDGLAAGAYPDAAASSLAERVEDLGRAAAQLLDDHRLEAIEVVLTLPTLEADIADSAVQATLEALPFSTDCALGLNACQEPIRTIAQLAADGAEHAALRLSAIPSAAERQILLACAEHRLPVSVVLGVDTDPAQVPSIVAHVILQLDAALQVGVSAPPSETSEAQLWAAVADLPDERCLAIRRILRWVCGGDVTALDPAWA